MLPLSVAGSALVLMSVSVVAVAAGFLLLLLLGDHGFGRQEQGGDAGGIAQRGVYDLGRVDHTHVDQIAVFLGSGVVAVVAVVGGDVLYDDGPFLSGVAGYLAERLFERTTDDVDALGLSIGGAAGALDGRDGADQRNATAGNDAFLDCGAGGVQGIFDAGLFPPSSRSRSRHRRELRQRLRPAWPGALAAFRDRSRRWSPRSGA